MKNDLTCGVVRDLLPLFVEGLTSEETNRAVDAHLAGCPDCAARRDAMSAPAEAEQAEAAKEVDYLKKVKRRSRGWVLLAVACTVLVLLAGYGANRFLIGSEAGYGDVTVLSSRTDADNRLYLTVAPVSPDTACYDWEVGTAGGEISISAQRVETSPFHASEETQLKIPLEGTSAIYLCGRLVWQDGVYIQDSTWALYEAKTPYVGNAAALGHIAAVLGITSKCGLFTNELHTSSEPYGWTLNFTASQMEGMAWRLNLEMERMAPLMLALVDNLGEVTWTYTDTRGEFHTRTVTTEDADAYIREHYEGWQELGVSGLVLLDSVKDYGSSPANLQRLYDIIMV